MIEYGADVCYPMSVLEARIALSGIYCCETRARVVCGTLVLLDRVECCGSSRRWGREVFRTDYRMGTCGVLELDCIVEVRRSEGENRTKFIVEEEEIR